MRMSPTSRCKIDFPRENCTIFIQYHFHGEIQLFIPIYHNFIDPAMEEISHSTSNPETKSAKLPQLNQTARQGNSRYMEKPWGFSIARSKKRDEQKWMRNKQIQFENTSLMNRMKSINFRSNSKNREESQGSMNPPKKTLHEHVRKEQSKKVREENEFKRRRVSSQRPTVGLKKLEKQWQDKLSFRHIYMKSKKKDSRTSRSIDLAQTQYPMKQSKVMKYYKEKDMGGVKIELRVEQYNHVLFISGLVKRNGLIMVMVLEKDLIEQILREECKGKVENFAGILKFEQELNSLYYLTSDKNLQQHMISDICSEYDLKVLRKAIQRQHQRLDGKGKSCRNSERSIVEEDSQEEQSVKPKSRKESASQL